MNLHFGGAAGKLWKGIVCILISFFLKDLFATELFAQDNIPHITMANVDQVRPLVSLEGYAVTYAPLIFSPDGRLLVTSSYNGARIWNIQTGKQVPFSGPGQVLQFSQDGKLLVLFDLDMTRLWDIDTDQELLAVSGRFQALSPNNTRLLTSGPFSMLWLWDAATGEQLALLNQAEYPFRPQFTPDGAFFVWNALDKTAHFWDVNTNTDHNLSSESVDQIAISTDGKLLAAKGRSGGMLWETGSTVPRSQFDAAGDTLQFSPDGSLLLSYYSSSASTGSSKVLIVDTKTGETIGRLTGGDIGNRVRFSPDSSKLVFYNQRARSEVSMQIWDAATRQSIVLSADWTRNVYEVLFGPDGTWLLAWGTAGRSYSSSYTVYAVDLATWNAKAVPFQGDYPQFSPDGTTLAVSVQSVILLYGIPCSARPVGQVLIPAHVVSSGINLRSAPLSDAQVIGTVQGDVLAAGQNNGFIYLADHDGWVRAGSDYIVLERNLPVDILPEIASSEAAAYNPPPTETPLSPTPIPSPVASIVTPTLPPVAVSAETPVPGGEFVPITPSTASQVRLLKVLRGYTNGGTNTLLLETEPEVRVSDWRNLTELSLPPLDDDTDIVFSPDGTVLAYATDTQVHLWDMLASQEIAVLDAHTQPVQQIVFSPDSRLVATTAINEDYHNTTDRSIQIWEAHTGTHRASLTFPSDRLLTSLVFNHHGTLLAASEYQDLTYVWDISTGAIDLTLAQPAGYTLFSADDTLIVTLAYWGGAARVWDAASGDTRAILLNSPEIRDVVFSPDQQFLLTLVSRSATYTFYTHPSGITLWSMSSGTQIAFYPKGCNATFSPDGKMVFVAERNGPLRVYDTVLGQELASFEINWCGNLVFSPDGQLLALGTAFLDLTTWSLIPIPGTSFDVHLGTWPYYSCSNEGWQVFSPDGSTLAVSGPNQTMIFGVPSAERQEQSPSIGHVVPTGIHVHDIPNSDSHIVDTVSGTVVVSGQAWKSLYLPELEGWVWSEYVDLGERSLTELPFLWPQCVP